MDMNGFVGSGLYPSQRCKIIHLIRHGEATHNVAGAKDRKFFLDSEFFDACLTPHGWNQVDDLRKHIKESGLASKIELVITSPLLRTMQTTAGVFGDECGSENEIGGKILMVENAGNSCRAAISSCDSPPFIAIEGCRERMGKNPCDRRRSISEYRSLFPAIDFSLVESEKDVLWMADWRETNEDLATRGINFFNWLWTRKEKEIAIVSHSAFLLQTLLLFGNNTHPSIKDEISKPFSNCELRSMVLVDTRMLGSDISKTNYCAPSSSPL